MSLTNPNVITPNSDKICAEIAIIGSGPSGAITAALLAEAGRDVVMIEEGPYLLLESAPHFSRKEIAQKYRNGGITVGMGKAKVSYFEGRCVGGGSEINRGLYHRTPPEVLEAWRREFKVEALTESEMQVHFDATEKATHVSYLQGEMPTTSLKLLDGAANLGWKSVEVPRMFTYASDSGDGGALGKKQSMTETFIPRFVSAGGRLLCDTRVRRLSRHAGRWSLRAQYSAGGVENRSLEISVDSVFVACGTTQTPAILRRSGIEHNIGNNLRFHPMTKVVACFPEEVNMPGQLDPVHQIKEFDPRFSMGCSNSYRPALAMTLMDNPERLAEVDRNWRNMAIYYAQTCGGRGKVRTLPGFYDPLVRLECVPSDMRDLGEGVRKLSECLFASGAIKLYPTISGCPELQSEADLEHIPIELPVDRTSFMTFHMFSTCPMGQDRSRCATDSFGKVYGMDGIYIADSSLLCGTTVVNPQGTVMAIAHRNAIKFLNDKS